MTGTIGKRWKNKRSKYRPSGAWARLRTKALKRYGMKCMRCGSKKYVQVDHVLAKSTHRHLEFKLDNLQILCAPCNMLKSNDKSWDFRPVNQNSKRALFIESLLTEE